MAAASAREAAHLFVALQERVGCGCPSLYSGGVIRRPSRGADFGVTRLSARERLPWFDGAAGERPAGGGRLSRDGSWHASQRSVLGRILARDGLSRVAARRSQNDTQVRDIGTSTP